MDSLTRIRWLPGWKHGIDKKHISNKMLEIKNWKYWDHLEWTCGAPKHANLYMGNMVVSIKKWMEKWHFSPHFQTQMDQAEIGAVGPTAEHLSRHCAHRLSKVMPMFSSIHPIQSYPTQNHSPICQVFQHSFIWCAEACWSHELLRSARTTAMRTPSRFYKAPEKKADFAIDFPNWWASKKRNIKNSQKTYYPITLNITSPSMIFGVFQSFPVIFPAFYQLHLFRWVELHPGFVQRHRWDSGGLRRGSLAIPMGKMESHLVISWFNHTMKKEGSN